MIYDLLIYVPIGYIIIGIATLMFEVFLEGKIFDTLIWEFKLARDITMAFLVLACVGAWPMVILYEVFLRKK